jgi:hypothetical protein
MSDQDHPKSRRKNAKQPNEGKNFSDERLTKRGSKTKIKLKGNPDSLGHLARTSEEQRPAPLVVVDRVRTPYQEVRAARAFTLHVEGWTVREIAVELGIDKDTAAKDIRTEALSLAKQREGERAQEIERQIARYERLYREAIETSTSGDMSPGDARAKLLMAAAKMVERIDKLLGVEAATKVQIDQKVTVDERRRHTLELIVGRLGPSPVLDVLARLDDPAEGWAGSTLSGETVAVALPQNEGEQRSGVS